METGDADAAVPVHVPIAPSLDAVLGLRSLSIVLSYLNECEGASLLLSQKHYWTDTILPLLRVKEAAIVSAHTNAQEQAMVRPKHQETRMHKQATYRVRVSGRNRKPVIEIPDASTRLDRLNTRRWNMRQRWRRKQIEMLRVSNNKNESGIRSDCSIDSDYSSAACHYCHNLTTTSIAEGEWKETVSIDPQFQFDRYRYRWIMNPPLLRFYGNLNDNGSAHPNSKKHSRFQDGTTCLASYPRSGNTLLRSLLETVTGFVTSSDTRPDRTLSIALAEKPPYFVGEGLAPPTPASPSKANAKAPGPFLPPSGNPSGQRLMLTPPPICKTHWPERIGCHAYDCQRVVLLVRNPFDAADSYWHMNLTNTHTKKVVPAVTLHHKAFYEELVFHEIVSVWTSFLEYYWTECKNRGVPLLLVRYEDLVLSPRDQLQRILEFCCSSNNNNKSSSVGGGENHRNDWWKTRLEEATRDSSGSADSNDSPSGKYGYRSYAAAEDPIEDSNQDDPSVFSNAKSSSSSSGSHPGIGRSLRRNLFPETLLRAIHDFDDRALGIGTNDLRPKTPGDDDGDRGKWLERLGYHVYKQGFPNNLHRLPPIPVLEINTTATTGGVNAQKPLFDGDSNNNNIIDNYGSLTINAQDVSLELRPRDSPYGRKMRQWRRQRTANDTMPFPTI